MKECERCGTKYNQETAEKCPACHFKRRIVFSKEEKDRIRQHKQISEITREQMKTVKSVRSHGTGNAKYIP